VRHNYIDRYARIDSPVHRLPPWLKLLASVLLILWTVVTPPSDTWFFAGCGVFLVVVVIAARIPAGFVAVRLLTLEPLVIGVAILALLQPGGLAVMLRILLKSNLCLLTAVVLSNTTPFGDILRVLRALRVPSLLVTILALMYRYVFLLIDQAERMTRARESRTFALRRTGRWKLAAGVVSQLFVRSTERAERIYAAMTARGWGS